MIHIFIPIGTAGSGKSTYYQKLTQHFSFKISRISADDVRFKLLDYEHTGKDYDESIEPQVWKIVYESFEQLLTDPECTQKQLMSDIAIPIGIYFDCTNLTVKERSQIIIRALHWHDTIIHMIVFDVSLFQSLTWNQSRKRKVPEKAIAQQFIRMENPYPYEYNTLTVIRIDPKTKNLDFQFPRVCI